MRKLLNSLYITSPNSYLTRDGENLLVLMPDNNKFRIPIHNIEDVICFGYQGASPAAMNFCAERGVGLSFHNEHGKFLARVSGPIKGNVLLRKEQYRIFDSSDMSLKLAINCIRAKISNTIVVLQRAIRDHSKKVNVNKIKIVISDLKKINSEILNVNNLDSLRGVEGYAARLYFGVADELILNQKKDFFIKTRNKRPPTDNFNTILSFLYTILAHNMQSALESVGLDPYIGFMHQIRPGRPALALDMMEELRSILVDRTSFSLVNRDQINKKGFIVKENGSVLMEDDTRKIVLAAWHDKKQIEIKHPFLNEKIPLGLLPYVQALLLARYIRGDMEIYPNYLSK